MIDSDAPGVWGHHREFVVLPLVALAAAEFGLFSQQTRHIRRRSLPRRCTHKSGRAAAEYLTLPLGSCP